MRSLKLSLLATAVISFSMIHSTYATPETSCGKLMSTEGLAQNHSYEKKSVFSANIPGAWSNFLHYTSNDETPTPTLVEAMKLYKQSNSRPAQSADLGTAAGKDTLYLLKNGSHVLAVDFSQEALNIVSDRAQTKRLPAPETQLNNFTNMSLPDNLDIVNANKSLPYVPPQDFNAVWKDVSSHIRKGGIFSGVFFTENDGYSVDPTVTTLTHAQLMCMFKNYKIVSLKKETADYAERSGRMKHWDTWNIVAIKKS